MNNSKRKVIVHKHMFKNAGTTFDWCLHNNFRNCFYDHRDDEPMRRNGQQYLIQFLKDHPNIKAISSHHIWFTFEPDNEFELIPIYLLRHPIERIKSVYKFEKIQNSNTIGAQTAKKTNFKDYVRWRMKDDIPPTIRNFQTRYLAGVKTIESLKKHHLETARRELHSNKFVGIVDLFELSMKIFEKEFRTFGFDLKLTSSTPQNVNQNIQNSKLDDRIKIILGELGDLADEVYDKNKFDIELYQIAKSLLSIQTNSIR